MTGEELRAAMEAAAELAEAAYARGVMAGQHMAEEEATKLRVALAAHQSHMGTGQQLVVDYLEPKHDRLSGGQLIDKLIEHFDGPEQRRIDKLAEGLL